MAITLINRLIAGKHQIETKVLQIDVITRNINSILDCF